MAASPSTEAGRETSSDPTHVVGGSALLTPGQRRGTRSNTPAASRQAKRRLGRIVVGSLAGGLLAAAALAALPFIPAEPSELTGAVLCGFALGWAMLATLTSRFGQPQRWARVPALVMGLSGLALVMFGSSADDALSWVWPPTALALAVWMVSRIRRDMASRLGRWLLYPTVALLGVVSLGAGTEMVLSAASPQQSMPGRLVDVGGHRLHLNCTGSGSPTVVLEPGAGMSSPTLGWIAPAVARETRVCVYDRAGRGWSDPTNTTQDAEQVATDLHALLHRAGELGPYVLAGHSFGGLYTLTYAAQYPTDVAGMVLIDSTAPTTGSNQPITPRSYDPMDRVSALLSQTARFGVMRLLVSASGATLPPASENAERASVATSQHLRSTIDEYRQGGASAEEAAALTSLDTKPLYVLTAGEGSRPGWMSKQNRLAALSTNSAHHVVSGAAHVDLVIDQRAAVATSRAVLAVVASARTGTPLEK